MSGPIYHYYSYVICKTCGVKERVEILSINPNKKIMTWSGGPQLYRSMPKGALVPDAEKPSFRRLLCGHLQDMEGEPVHPHNPQ